MSATFARADRERWTYARTKDEFTKLLSLSGVYDVDFFEAAADIRHVLRGRFRAQRVVEARRYALKLQAEQIEIDDAEVAFLAGRP